MRVDVKFTFNLGCLFSRKTLPFMITLLFVVSLFSSPFISGLNGFLIISASVETEVELRAAIDAAPDGEGYAIYVLRDIVLEESLVISEGKSIALVSYDYDNGVSLIGADGVDTIIVESGGLLRLYGSLIITHAKGDTGRGVYVKCDGEFAVFGGVISGNTADKGGGVYNEGTFYLREGNTGASAISGNSATFGGGLYNEGAFNMVSGAICDNVATIGGGVYNTGIFDRSDDAQIHRNTALSGEGDDVFTETKSSGQFYLLLIGVAIVGGIAGLLVYHSKRRKPSVVNE